MSNITEVTFSTERYAVTAPLYQYDYGQVLKITAPSLPDPYTVHFGNARSCGESLTVIGTASDGAAIPSALLATGLNVYAWVFLHTGENDGETEYMIEIPVIRRAEPTDDPVIEEDPSAVDIIMGEISSLKDEISELGGLSDDVKQALLQLASKVAYIDDDGQTYYDALYNALYPPADLVSISAVYTQSGVVTDADTLDSLKPDLVVTATYDDSTTATVTTYTLSGTLTEGTSTITVSYGGKTTTFTVEVTHQELPTGYTKYDYITPNVSFGTQTKAYGIWTDAQLSTDYTIEIKLKFPSDLGSNLQAQPIIGTRSSGSGTKEIALFFKYGQGTLGYWYSGTDSTTSITLTKGSVHTIKFQPVGVSQTYSGYATFDIDGTEYSTGSTATGVTFDSWFGIFTYAINANGGISTGDVIYVGQQIGEIIVTDSNGDAVYDFVPAKDPDGKYGFYEKVNGAFYYNSTYASTGFIGGDWT